MFSIFRPRVALNSARQGLWKSLYFPVVHDGARSAHDHACDAKSQRVLHLRLFNNLNRDQIVNQDSYRCTHVPKPKMEEEKLLPSMAYGGQMGNLGLPSTAGGQLIQQALPDKSSNCTPLNLQ